MRTPTITSINPATDEPIREYALMDASAVRKAVAACDRAFRVWRATAWIERATRMQAAARVLRDRTAEFARLMTAEMGKP